MVKNVMRKVYQGRVVSVDGQTITVVVDTYKVPCLRQACTLLKYYAHDENNEAKTGDTVQIMETRPLSAKKRFRLVKIVEKAATL